MALTTQQQELAEAIADAVISRLRESAGSIDELLGLEQPVKERPVAPARVVSESLPEGQRVFTIDDLAKFFDVTWTNMQQRKKRGELTPLPDTGRRVLFDRKEVERFKRTPEGQLLLSRKAERMQRSA